MSRPAFPGTALLFLGCTPERCSGNIIPGALYPGTLFREHNPRNSVPGYTHAKNRLLSHLQIRTPGRSSLPDGQIRTLARTIALGGYGHRKQFFSP